MRGHTHAKQPAAVAIAMACAALVLAGSCSRPAERQGHKTFKTPEDAVHALNKAVASGNVEEVRAIFGPDGRELVDQSDPVTARQNREVYVAAMKEGWRLVDNGSRKELVVGRESWPFPVPLMQDTGGWRFDTAAGKTEVLERRIGRNELNAINTCHTYVAAQRRYALEGHDGKPAGLYARTFSSNPGMHNGLYWSAARGERRSPLGELLKDAEAHAEARAKSQARAPFHGYYFRILTAQGDAAGAAMNYVVNGELSRGFALVAWPAQYERTGIMTFIVNQDAVVYEKDLGPATDAEASKMTVYNPGDSWTPVR